MAAAFIAAAMMGTAIWYVVIIGRDRPKKKQRRGESTIETYGDISEDHAPLPKFLIYTFVGTAVWALGYLIWAGYNSPTGYR